MVTGGGRPTVYRVNGLWLPKGFYGPKVEILVLLESVWLCPTSEGVGLGEEMLAGRAVSDLTERDLYGTLSVSKEPFVKSPWIFIRSTWIIQGLRDFTLFLLGLQWCPDWSSRLSFNLEKTSWLTFSTPSILPQGSCLTPESEESLPLWYRLRMSRSSSVRLRLPPSPPVLRRLFSSSHSPVAATSFTGYVLCDHILGGKEPVPRVCRGNQEEEPKKKFGVP